MFEKKPSVTLPKILKSKMTHITLLIPSILDDSHLPILALYKKLVKGGFFLNVLKGTLASFVTFVWMDFIKA